MHQHLIHSQAHSNCGQALPACERNPKKTVTYPVDDFLTRTDQKSYKRLQATEYVAYSVARTPYPQKRQQTLCATRARGLRDCGKLLEAAENLLCRLIQATLVKKQPTGSNPRRPWLAALGEQIIHRGTNKDCGQKAAIFFGKTAP
ncbi:hypothetical protein [Pseudomonas sp. TE3610]